MHLIETSPKLSQIQKENLSEGGDAKERTKSNDDYWYQHCKTKYGQDVFWYDSIDDVPRGTSFFVANEFFDALPILVFQVSSVISTTVLGRQIK